MRNHHTNNVRKRFTWNDEPRYDGQTLLFSLDGRTRRSRRAGLDPTRPHVWDRLWSSLDRPTARSGVAIGLVALIALGSLIALGQIRSGPADAGPPVDNTPPVSAGMPGDEQPLFWNEYYVGYWQNDRFIPAQSGAMQPDWLVGSEIELRNQSGAIVTGTVVECQGAAWFVSPAQYSTGVDAYWYPAGAPYAITQIDLDDGEQELDALLTDSQPYEQDEGRYDSVGAPLAADGSADRLVWEERWGMISWLATYDIETNTLHTVLGEAGSEPDFEVAGPKGAWLDLDNDGNLESIHYTIGQPEIVEWATGDKIWVAGPQPCQGGKIPIA